jgi:hypothetical protein
MKTAHMALIAASIAVTSSAQAKIRMVKNTCPFPADVALKVVGLNNEMDGVAAEYAWLRSDRPGWKVIQQYLAKDRGKVFDGMLIMKDGARQTLCFDITDFFGKY